MVNTYQINGIRLKTGDLICTRDGHDEPIIAGQFWRVIGMLIPGDIDHIAIYIGPEGLCMESGPIGVTKFNVLNNRWDAKAMRTARGGLLDTFIGVACPINPHLSNDDETIIRKGIAEYCLAQEGKPYNLNFFNPDREDAFYCSQLAYRAYLKFGLDLNTGRSLLGIPGSDRIIFPQEIWDGCMHLP